jgi:hypothetical protein
MAIASVLTVIIAKPLIINPTSLAWAVFIFGLVVVATLLPSLDTLILEIVSVAARALSQCQHISTGISFTCSRTGVQKIHVSFTLFLERMTKVTC